MTNSQRLKKIHQRAKELIRKHPAMKYSTAQKRAGAELRGKGVKKPGKKSAAHPKATQRKRAPRARISGVPDTPSLAQAKSAATRSIEEQLAWALLARQSAKNVRERKQKAKRVTELNKKLRAARSL